jgi:hypothetical protein
MIEFGKSVDDYSNGVKLVTGERQLHNKIDINVFPFLNRNTQRWQKSEVAHITSPNPTYRIP